MGEVRKFTVPDALEGQTLAAVLRRWQPEMSWSVAKRMIVTRRVTVNGTLCLNDARRLRAGEEVTLLEEPGAPVPREHDVRVLRIDPDLIVIDKPAGVITLRRDEERDMSPQRKSLQPSLDELLQRLLAGSGRAARASRPRRGRARDTEARPAMHVPLYAVHRLDRDTSGVMLFALSARARDVLIGMFARHQVQRTYIAVVHGHLPAERTIESWIVRDRGDGLRGSLPPGSDTSAARQAITHVRPIEHLGRDYTVVECRLETGRTHQIRIHLSEIGHMLCGEKLYLKPIADAPERKDTSGAPRQALHSAEMRLSHPITGEALHFASPLPGDLSRWLQRLRERYE